MMRVTRSLILGFALFAAAGCGSLTPSPGFGVAVNEATERMLANPEAPADDSESAQGLLGPTAQDVVEIYHRGQREQERKGSPKLDVGF